MEMLKNFSEMNYEDFVEYKIYTTDFENSEIKCKEWLQNLRDECLSLISSDIVQYMWHQDPFILMVKENYLYGRIKIGDNIEDEWYAISLLFKLTELNPSLVVKVSDQDGEVLLIEAADHLPKWAQDPETSENRAYIYRNKLHLIPVAQNPSQLTPLPAGVPNVDDAINTVHTFPEATQASEQIQSSLKHRMKLYPENWSDQKQFIHVIVPEKIKFLLNIAPKHLISAAIRCFYTRDVIDLRKCRVMKQFPSANMTKVGLTLSKCLYAMLVKQQFQPDKKLNWPMPPQSQINEYKAADLGYKISCGFEMLLAQSKSDICNVDLDCKMSFDKIRYSKFETNLIANGYFKDELRGSKKWRILTEQAKEHFRSVFSSKNSQDGNICDIDNSEHLQNLVFQIEHKSSIVTSDDISLQDELSKKPDDDTWLDFEPASFDEMLKNHFNFNENNPLSDHKAETISKEQAIPTELKKFLSSMSNFEGIDSLPTESENSSEMCLNVKDFERAAKKMFNVNDHDNLSDLELSEEEEDLNQDAGDVDPEWKICTEQIENELQHTKVMQSTEDNELIESLEDINKPVNIDMGIFKNIIESYNSQNGMPGPATTLLQSINVDIDEQM